MGTLFGRSAVLKNLDFTVGAWLCRAVGRVNYWQHREVFLDAVDPKALKHILVIRPGGMGDLILLLPVLDALNAVCPNAEIDLVCERRNSAVMALGGFEGRVLSYDKRPLELLATLKRTPYDLAIDSEQFHHFSAFFAWLSGAPVRVGFNINPLRNPLYTHLVPYAPDGREADQFAALLGPLNGAIDVEALEGRLRATPNAGADGAVPRTIALHTGSGAPYKCWPENRFAELATRLLEAHDVDLLFVGSGAELDVAKRIADRLPAGRARVAAAASPPSLRETARELGAASVFIGADSGLAHLAEALGVPSIVLFGPSSESKWGPQASHSRVVSHNVPCRPCCVFGYRKPCHDIACMHGIGVEAALSAVADVMTRCGVSPTESC